MGLLSPAGLDAERRTMPATNFLESKQWLHLYLQWAFPIQDIFLQLSINDLRLFQQSVAALIQRCPILVVHGMQHLEFLFLFSVSFLFVLSFWRSCFQLSHDGFLNILHCLTFHQTSPGGPVFFAPCSTCTFWAVNSIDLGCHFSHYGYPTFATRLPFPAWFHFRLWACSWLWDIFFYLLVSYSIGSCFMLGYAI